MTTTLHPVSRVRYHAEKSLAHASPFIKAMARAGYAAKGVVYCIIGLLALLASMGSASGATTGSRGAIHNLLGKPGGVILVALLAVGLAGYALWSFVQALVDPDGLGTSWKGLAARMGRFSKGVVHLSLVAAAIGMVTGRHSSAGDGDPKIDQWTAKLMSLPFGIWLVGVVGMCVIGYGVYQLVRAWRASLDRMLSVYEIDPRARRAILNVSRFGVAARGIVFGVIGVGLVLAALHANPHEALGIGGALRWLVAQTYGPFLLAVVALGMASYGIYEFIRARYRMIRPA
jgi:hypothetical protein